MASTLVSLFGIEIDNLEYGNFQDPNEVMAGLSSEATKIGKNFVFFSLNGKSTNILSAAKAGAKFIVMEEGMKALADDFEPPVKDKIVFYRGNIRKLYAEACSKFFHLEKLSLKICGITGTNGKSSVAYFFKQISEMLGSKAACIGTTGVYASGQKHKKLDLTTPDAGELSSILSELGRNNILNCALETSSHGLDQHRIDGLKFAVAVFTNFSHDHLDYHINLENYWKAKKRLFTEIPVELGYVINIDDEKSQELVGLISSLGRKCIKTGTKAEAEIKILKCEPTQDFQTAVTLDIQGKIIECCLPLIGEFQIQNVVSALGAFSLIDPSADFTKLDFTKLRAPPGRMELLKARNGSAIIIDYAHTPDGLLKALKAIKKHTQDIITVFGCGGGRDQSKRKEMGEIASKHSSLIIVTDDNPRNEDPAQIRRQIISGCSTSFLETGNRKAAIRKAMQLTDSSHAVLIAGKGHEDFQIMNNHNVLHDDVGFVKEIISNDLKSIKNIENDSFSD